MKTLIVEKKNPKFYMKVTRLEFDEIPKMLYFINEDITILYHDEFGELKFLAKYVKNVIHDPNNDIKERLTEFVKDKPIGTYLVEHDENTKKNLDIIENYAKDIKDKYFKGNEKKEDSFHFFYNQTILNHRDCLYETLRSLHVLKNEMVKGFFVFTDFDLYIDMMEGDLLLFDASQYHYMIRNIKETKELYRFGINMI